MWRQLFHCYVMRTAPVLLSFSFTLFSAQKNWITSTPFLQIETKCFLVAVREQTQDVNSETESGICVRLYFGQKFLFTEKNEHT